MKKGLMYWVMLVFEQLVKLAAIFWILAILGILFVVPFLVLKFLWGLL